MFREGDWPFWPTRPACEVDARGWWVGVFEAFAESDPAIVAFGEGLMHATEPPNHTLDLNAGVTEVQK